MRLIYKIMIGAGIAVVALVAFFWPRVYYVPAFVGPGKDCTCVGIKGLTIQSVDPTISFCYGIPIDCKEDYSRFKEVCEHLCDNEDTDPNGTYSYCALTVPTNSKSIHCWENPIGINCEGITCTK